MKKKKCIICGKKLEECEYNKSISYVDGVQIIKVEYYCECCFSSQYDKYHNCSISYSNDVIEHINLSIKINNEFEIFSFNLVCKTLRCDMKLLNFWFEPNIKDYDSICQRMKSYLILS